jgi:hypothetical protein
MLMLAIKVASLLGSCDETAGVYKSSSANSEPSRSPVSRGLVERSIAWLGFNRRLSKDYERYVQTSETLLDIAAIRAVPK